MSKPGSKGNKGLLARQYEADMRLLDGLVFLREHYGLSQAQLAERMNMPVECVERIENGETSLAPLLARYANEIGAVVEYTIKPAKEQ